MNHAQVDYLLQLPVPRPEPAPPASRGRDDAPAFDNHFRQASGANAATTSSPAAPTRPSATERDDDRRPSTNSAPPAKSESTAEDVAETDEARDADEAELAETAGAAALLAPAEQATQAIGSDAAVDADNTAPHSVHPDGASAQPAAEAHGEPTSAAVDARAAAAQLAQPDTAEQDLAAAIAENASADSPESQQASAHEDGNSPRVNAKSLSGEHGPNDKAVGGDAGEQQAVVQSAAAVHSGDPTPATKTENRKSAVDGASKKSDKKSNTRAEAALRDAATPPNERTPASARSADAPAIAPTAANVQAQLQPGGTASTASVDSTTKPKDALAGVKEGLFSPFARLERNSAGGATGSRRTGRGEGAPHVDPARFVSRVARAIQTAEERGGPLQLRLSPPELGAMRLEISVNQGALTATIETENSTARQLLLDNLPALRDRLAEQNVKIERFDVDVRRDTSGNGQPNFGPQEHGQHDRHNPLPDRHGAARRAAAPQVAEVTSPIRRAITNTSINVVA